ncbi:MAG: AbrB/MazE/SpoVT family DNA-binding domain-containing protein, partial [bacterium]
MTRARITSKGQLTIPKEVRERLGVQPGDSLEFAYQGDRLEVRPLRRRRLEEFRGLFPISSAARLPDERRRAW